MCIPLTAECCVRQVGDLHKYDCL
mgnify:CR=1